MLVTNVSSLQSDRLNQAPASPRRSDNSFDASDNVIIGNNGVATESVC